ncbi:TetR/AcrR family transcriptional regulator [Actinomyces minihominis]|uniref:TetR/AcrR family transcriptional regulator n=1 Tax=Actinomyces minihominis TaxID=2002838 RepID=UPI000C081893|nr:TetR/AcrR family transcriptional regulator [Actinomyces minihominis]
MIDQQDEVGASEPASLASRVTSRPEDDPRFQRIRAKLEAAILELASAKPAEQISVSELTTAAGVSRTTFYKHSTSPSAFLAEYLIERLRPVLDPIAHLLDYTGPGYLLKWRQIHLDLLAHIAELEKVYQKVLLVGTESVVLTMISTYFESVFGEFVRSFARRVDGPPPSALWVQMASSQQVYNTVTLISSWLKTGMEASVDEVVAAYFTLLPPWQEARFSESGRTTLRVDPVVGLLSATFDADGKSQGSERGADPHLLVGRGRINLGTASLPSEPVDPLEDEDS